MVDDVNSIARIAIWANLSVPSVRYWAEVHGDLIGARRMPDGEWHFSTQAQQFFQCLEDGPRSGHGQGVQIPDTAQARPNAVAESAATAETQMHLSRGMDTAGQLHRRVEQLALHVGDLDEETKQVQRLLSRIIEWLYPAQAETTPRRVRPWRPRRVERPGR